MMKHLPCLWDMKHIACIATLALLACGGVFAQSEGGNVAYQVSGQAGGQAAGAPGEMMTTRTMAIGAFAKPTAPVTGAPYSATITNEFVQTLADGNRIVNNSSGTVARDSQGRTRQDAPVPEIGNVSAANAPHIVFIQDPVAQVNYTLNLTDKTAQKIPESGPAMPGMGFSAGGGVAAAGVAGPCDGGRWACHAANICGERWRRASAAASDAGGGGPVFIQRSVVGNDPSQVSTEDLGSQTMQGVTVTGTRTTRTIPAGQIGNDAAIKIVTEVWTSPDLKTVVYSKRTDPRMGEQTFQLTNITRAEPDASLFTVPADFTVSDGPKPIIYRLNQ